MTPSRIYLCSFLLLICYPISSVAFPSGAAACPEREPAVGGPHIQTNPAKITTGPLSKGDITLWLNGMAMPEGERIQIPLNTDIQWVISTNGAAFRGFLIRLGDGSNQQLDTSDALSSPSIPENAKHAIACFDVGGITHTDNDEKMDIAGSLLVDEESLNMPLDVTVVIENRNGVSTFYHTTFEVDALMEGGIMTTLPPPPSTTMNRSFPDGVITPDPSEMGSATMNPSFPDGATMDPSADPSGSDDSNDSGDSSDNSGDDGSSTMDPSSGDDGATTIVPTFEPTGDGFPDEYQYCGDQWAFGEVEDGKCYAWDSGYCVIEYTYDNGSSDCEEIDQTWYYYNQVNDAEGNPLEVDLYAQVSASVNTCSKECTLSVNGNSCKCSMRGRRLTMEVCSSDGIEGTFATPQTIKMGEGGSFVLTPTEDMCNHPAVTQQSDVDRRGGDAVKPSTRGGDAVKQSTGDARIIRVPTTMTYFFESGTGAEIDTPAKTDLFMKMMKFFREALKQDAAFMHTLQDVTMDRVKVNYDDDDTWTVSFMALISVDRASKATQGHSVRTLAGADWDQYVHLYVHHQKRNQLRHIGAGESSSVLDNVEKVKFRGVGFGHRLR